MQPELLIAVSTGLGAMLGWGFADFFAKKTIDEIGALVSLVWAHVFGTCVIGLVMAYRLLVMGQSISFPTEIGAWGLLILFGALQAVIYLLAYTGFGKGQLALLNPIFASYSGIAALISLLFLGEIIRTPLIVSILIIFAGVLLLNIDTEALRAKRFSLKRAPGLKEVGIAALLASVWTISWDAFIGGHDWLAYAFCMYAFMTIAAYAIAWFQKLNLRITKKTVWKFLFLVGACEVVAYMAISLGFSLTSYLSIVAVLSGAFSLPTIILARVFLKERVTRLQTAGSIVIIAGIILLSLV